AADHRAEFRPRRSTRQARRACAAAHADHRSGDLRLGAVQLGRPGLGADHDRPHAVAGLHRADRRGGRGLTNQRLVILLAAASIFFLPAHPVTGPLLESSRSTPAGVLRVGVMTCGLIYAAILVATGTFSPFLYYQF